MKNWQIVKQQEQQEQQEYKDVEARAAWTRARLKVFHFNTYWIF